ncbi:type II toxin-antitoxin system RelE/ParE family toxin [Necropsobacter rosorum]|uniref:type II toxin-antitoxin system RelE/ParE family toxin n=1 Tax=Necropsobacter rosorum TaxID=908285 RepID=UPI000509A6CA
MAKKLLISKLAERNIDEILQNVYEFTSSATSSQKLLNDFIKHFELISMLPKSGKLQADKTRITFCRHYRIVYQEAGEFLEIITVIHSRRKYPQL